MSNKHPKTDSVLKLFEEISKIPRKSKNEDAIRQWLLNWAKERDLETKTDKVGNVLIKAAGTKGYEKSKIVVLQGHMDMVCEKTPDSNHDFSKDPIEFVFDGDWLKANKTTLGADNGIALAMAMIMAIDPDVAHPPLELLFTVDEETGLTGASNLDPKLINGRTLLNIDTEDEGVITIGCAGGMDSDITIPLKSKPTCDSKTLTLKTGGMKGGHSGVDIHLHRANAIRVLIRAIHSLKTKFNIGLSDIKGGSAHNAIPRDAEAIISCSPSDINALKAEVSKLEEVMKAEFNKTDPSLFLSLDTATTEAKKVLTTESLDKLVDTLFVMPHGVAAMDTGVEGLVETSNNLATIAIDGDNLRILSSQRSSVMSRLEALTQKINSLVNLVGGSVECGDGYPAWEPNWESPLVAKSKAVYEKLFKKEPIVEIIHAGLECGIIASKCDGMDMISIGPTIKNPHSPDECMKVSDVGKIWDFVVALFAELK